MMNRIVMILILVVVFVLSLYFALAIYSNVNAKPSAISTTTTPIIYAKDRPLPCVACVHLRGSQ